MSRAKKVFKVRCVVLGILLVLVIVAAAVIGTHWDLIKAAKTGLTTDSATIQANQEEKDREIRESLGVEGMITDEMIAQAQAEIEQSWAGTEESPVADTETSDTPDFSGGGQTEEQGQQPSGQSQPSSQAGSAPASGSVGAGGSSGSSGGQTKEDITAKYTAKLLGIRGAFEGRVNGLISSAKTEYAALPAEQQTSSAQSAILSSKMGEAGALEAECDAKVDALLSEMSAELSAAGQSTDAVGQLRSYYEETKANTKAAYLAQARGS